MSRPMSLNAVERARKGIAHAMKALQEPGKAATAAAAMGLSEATASRIKNERLEEAITFLAHIGCKVVPSDAKCVDATAYEFLVAAHLKVMQLAPNLILESE